MASVSSATRYSDSASSAIADVHAIRGHFPALLREQGGLPVAYFDGPGGTQVPRSVVDAVGAYLCRHNANTHWNYPTSAETDAILASARSALADLLGGDAEEIVFGANATTLAFHVSRALASMMGPDDEIVVTELDHHANIGPWERLAKERGSVLRVVRMVPETGELDWDDFADKVNSRTRLVAVGAASNALGTINDLQRASRLARGAGALVFVDAVHYVPHRLFDVRAVDCDFVVASAYKFYGPHVGVLWCRGALLGTLPFPKVAPAADFGPERAETGTLNHEGIAGALAAVDFLAALSEAGDERGTEPASGGAAPTEETSVCRGLLKTTFAAIEPRSLELTARMWSGLAALPGVSLYGPPPGRARTSTVAFTVHGMRSCDVATALAAKGLFVSHGNFYAATVVERLGLGADGLVRAGCACYTTVDEVERLLSAVETLAGA